MWNFEVIQIEALYRRSRLLDEAKRDQELRKARTPWLKANGVQQTNRGLFGRLTALRIGG